LNLRAIDYESRPSSDVSGLLSNLHFDAIAAQRSWAQDAATAEQITAIQPRLARANGDGMFYNEGCAHPAVPQMKRKGRIEIGADADLVVFEPQRITNEPPSPSRRCPKRASSTCW